MKSIINGEVTGLNVEQLEGHPSSDFSFKQSIYTTITATTEGWYRVATIDITKQFKNALFKVKAYTATGTVTECMMGVNIGYYSGNYSNQQSSIWANTSHSYNAWTNAENGYVLLYARISFDGTTGYLDLYKYKATAVTIEIQPLVESDWVWATGSLTVNPVIGAYRNNSINLTYGFTGTNLQASYAGGATYSSYGTLGSTTISNTTDKTGQWEYFGNWEFDFNASYLEGKSGNIRVRFQEISSDGSITNNLDDFTLTIKVGLATHTDSSSFNSLIPTISMEVDGKTTINPSTDICALVYSTNTTNKIIRFYIKLKSANTIYTTNPQARYGRSFNNTTLITTSYSNFNLADQQATITSLPTPAQGSVVYATKKVINTSDLNNDAGFITSAQAGTIITVNASQPSGSKSGDIWIQTF